MFYSNLPKLQSMVHSLPVPVSNTAFNLPTQVLPAPISHCAQAYANPLTPCAGNFCSNHFNSYHNYYDACNSPCDGFGFLY